MLRGGPLRRNPVETGGEGGAAVVGNLPAAAGSATVAPGGHQRRGVRARTAAKCPVHVLVGRCCRDGGIVTATIHYSCRPGQFVSPCGRRTKGLGENHPLTRGKPIPGRKSGCLESQNVMTHGSGERMRAVLWWRLLTGRRRS